MTRWLLVFVALLGAPAIARAQDQHTFLDLVVNQVAKGDALVVLRGADALIGVSTLTDAGLAGFEGRRETIDRQPFVSLQSLRPDVTFSVNERDLTLTLTVSATLLPAVVRDLQADRPRDLVYRRNSSLFLNYALNAGDDRNYDVQTESGATVGRALIYNTFSMNQRGPVRGLSSVNIDQSRALRRWTIGDSFAGGAALGGDPLVAGVTVSREFSLDPYFVRYPTLSVSTPVLTPSVVELHVDGRMVRQEQVQPGRLDLRNLPLTTGHNDAQVVVRDAFGGTRELSTTYYLTSSVLARGVQDYQYSAGMTRGPLGYASWNYERPVALARHRIGLTDSLTAGGHVEVTPGLINGGPSLNIRLPFGEVEGAAAFSQRGPSTALGAGRRRGTAALGSYMYAGRTFSGGGSIRVMSPEYETLTLGHTSQRSRMEASVFAAVPVSHGVSLSVQHTQAAMVSAPSRSRTGLQASAHVFSRANLVMSAARVEDERGGGREMSVGLTVRFGQRTTATTSTSADREGTRTAVDVQQSLPTSTGFGYQLRTQTGSNVASGVLQYQGKYGRYDLRREMVGNIQHSTVSAAGALVAIGGGVYATRPVTSSFALVRVPGVGNVRGFASHQEIGKTDRGGNLLVPNLLPYYANQLNISDADVPIDYSISNVSQTLAPPYRGGALVVFPVEQIRSISGRVQITGGEGKRSATYGQLTTRVGGKEMVSPIGSDGKFYFENLPAGKHAAKVQYADGECTVTLDVPASGGAVVNLGTVLCTVTEGR